MSKSLILVSTLPEDQEFAAEAAVTAGLTLSVAPGAEEAVEKMLEQPRSVIMVDSSDESKYRAFESFVQKKIGLFSDNVSANRMHFISQSDLQDVGYLFKSPIFGHYIMRNYGDPKVAGRRYGYLLKGTLEERAFELKNLLPGETRIQKVTFQSTSQKQEGG